ncbi:hypothetical protein ABIA16_003452 [Sinorhizobium fredii]
MNLHLQTATATAAEFEFPGKRRKFEPVEALPYIWPTKTNVANDYIADWLASTSEELGKRRLSKLTLECIASHVSRRDGSCCLTDRALAARSGRSLASTKRDIDRLKKLGRVIAEYEGGSGFRKRVRKLKIAVPAQQKKSPRIPLSDMTEVVSTYPPYVETLDKGECRDD